jgi:hypothetical protein
MKTRAVLLGLVLSLCLTPGLQAQSLFNAAGLGLPLEALDGRARSLGNLGIGLPGSAFLPTDPGALGRMTISTGIIAGQPSWVDYSQAGGASGNFQANRFPLMGLAYPVLSGMMSVQVGSFLDQTYRQLGTGSVVLGTGTVDTSDEFVQDGSVSNLNVGFARMVTSDLSVGVTLGRYAGSVDRTLTRTYGDGSSGIDDYVEAGVWSYVGHSLTAGAAMDMTPDLRVAASIQMPTNLKANASEETRGVDGSFDIPIQYRLGASANVGSSLLVTGSLAFADWSGTQSDLSSGGFAGDTNAYGVGVELTRARLWGKDAPLRFGFRRSGLPFSFTDSGASERVFAGGLGLVLNTTNEIVLAGLDMAIERGRRSGGGLIEDFWRATISLRASGF